MEETMSRILVGTFVKRMLKEIRESPERNTRNLVDMALQFSRGRFQQHFFGAAQTMLQKEDSGYYALVRDTVAWADLDRLYTFGMNLGYNGCTAGAQRIRDNEKRLGCNIPWTILLELDTEGLDRTGPRYHALIREGEALGVFVWTLLTGERPALVLPLVKKHPDSAFFLFCAPGDVTPAFLDGAAEVNNLMAAVRYGEGAADACAALRKKGLLCSVWYQYGQKDTEAILNGKLFDGAQQLSPIFTILLPEPDCPAPVQRLAHQAVEQARMEQTYRTALWEAQGDNRKVDTVISDDACAACFDRDGTIREWGRRLSCAPNNLFESGLTDLLTAAFPKKGSERMSGETIGIVDVGGGYRGIYASGVLDYCMDHRLQFDVGVGVSAGSANLISYAAGQRGRNFQFYSEYGLRKEYAGIRNFLFKRSFLDLDYVYGTLSNSGGENPLDYAAAKRSPMKFCAVATEAETGRARYFGLEDLAQDDYSVLKASCAIPFVCRPYAVGDTLYYDGALSDTIPIQKAFELGCDRAVLLLTLPEDTVRTPDRDQKLARRIRKKYPLAAKRLEQRARRYNEGVALARRLAAEGRVLIVAPDDTCGVQTLCRDAGALRALYQKGYQDGAKIPEFLHTRP